jgi:hypothetical protein
MRTMLVLIALLAATGCSKTIHEARTDPGQWRSVPTVARSEVT